MKNRVSFFFECKIDVTCNGYGLFLAADKCKGVCVTDRIAEYCEAYLTSSDWCKEGTKCCVSLDDYANTKMPKDIYIPASKY